MKSISRKGGQKIPTWASTLGVGVFMIPVVVIFYFFSVVPLGGWLDAEDWPTTECTITHSELHVGEDSDGDPVYTLDIVYDYTWEGVAHTSDRFDFAGGSNYTRSVKEAFVEQYAEGTQHPCFVNPDAPEDSVLNRDFNITYLLGVGAMLFPTGLLVFMLIRRRRQGHKSLSVRGKLQERPTDPGFDHGPITLKGKNNRIVILVLVTIFAVFWNGIVAIMSTSILPEIQSDGIMSWTSLFLLLFMLIGLGLIGAVLYNFLALFNPKPDLTLTPGYLPLGGSATLEWQFRGNAQRIRKLTVTLVGEEKATYRRGTDTVTDTNRFEVITLIDTKASPEIAQGSVTLSIPEFSVPTFHAPNNKIRWHLKVNGDIPRWPDVSQEFELTIAPLPTGRDTVTPSLAEFTLN